MQTVGEQLQRARLEQGLDLHAVADLTKINLRYLQAIEADDRHGLPSGFFYRSFVHQYAGVLGLEAAPLDAEVERIISADAPLPLPGQESAVARFVAPIKPDSPDFHWTRPMTYAAVMLLVVLASCSGVYVWWHNGRSVANAQVNQVAAPPTPVQHEEPKVVLASQPVSPRAIPATAIPGYKVMVDLIAHETTWLAISSDGQPVFSGVLSANETKTIEGRESAKMRIGNAAGVEVRFNGKSIGSLGARGQVLTVLFTPGNFQILQPAREGDD